MQKILTMNIRLKWEVFLLGLVDEELGQKWNFVIVYNCSENSLSEKMERYINPHNWRVVENSDGVSRDDKPIWILKIAYLLGNHF